MNDFLWTGQDAQGNKCSKRVRAVSADAAKQILVEQGWGNLRLVKDEFSSAGQAMVESPAEYKVEVSPQGEVDRFIGKRPCFTSRWWEAIVEAKVTIAFLAAMLILGIFIYGVPLIVIGAVGLLFVIFLFPPISFFFSLSSIYFTRLNRAKVWARWEEVLRCVERLKQTRRLTRIGVKDWELSRNRAIALAGLGRLEEGLAEFSQYENSSIVPHWVYLGLLPDIYTTAGRFDKALEIRRQLVAEKRDSAAAWIDLASILARRFNKPAEAREALIHAEALETPELGRMFLPFVYGMVCWREGSYSESRQLLETALAGFQQIAHKPLVEGVILTIKSYLCAVHRALGSTALADGLLREVEDFLVAHREEELLQACRGMHNK